MVEAKLDLDTNELRSNNHPQTSNSTTTFYARAKKNPEITRKAPKKCSRKIAIARVQRATLAEASQRPPCDGRIMLSYETASKGTVLRSVHAPQRKPAMPGLSFEEIQMSSEVGNAFVRALEIKRLNGNIENISRVRDELLNDETTPPDVKVQQIQTWEVEENKYKATLGYFLALDVPDIPSSSYQDSIRYNFPGMGNGSSSVSSIANRSDTDKDDNSECEVDSKNRKPTVDHVAGGDQPKQLHESPKRASEQSGPSDTGRKRKRTRSSIDKSQTKDDESDVEYTVEKILTCRGRRGEPEFYVKWEGYASDENTWEPRDNLTGCSDILSEFEEKHGEQLAAIMKKNNKGKGKKVVLDLSSDDEWIESKSQKNKNKHQRNRARTTTLDSSSDESDSERMLPSHATRGQKFRRDMKDLTTLVLTPMPTKLPEKYETLSKKEWISNFIIDDVIASLIDCYDLSSRVTYVSSLYYKYIQSGNHYQDVCKQLYKQSAILADVLLVLTCTGDMESADHWILGIISKPQQKIYLLDSVEDDRMRKDVFRNLAIIVGIMYDFENLSTDLNDWQFIYSDDCLVQHNNYDCGAHVLLNTYSILQGSYVPKMSSVVARQWIYNHLIKYIGDRAVQTPLKREFLNGVAENKLLGRTVSNAITAKNTPFQWSVQCDNTNKAMKKLLLNARL